MQPRIYIRTHYINATISELFALWSLVLPGRVTLLVDETAGVHQAGDMPKVTFSLQSLAEMGLPELPKGKALWHTGDYAMAVLAPVMAEDEFAILLENDAVPVLHDLAGWRGIIDALIKGDLAISNLNRRGSHWKWRQDLDAIYRDEELCGCKVVLMGFTRETARRMAHRRREIADQVAKGLHAQWPNVEAFVAIEAGRMGLKTIDLDDLIPDLNRTLTVSDPYWWAAMPQDIGRNTILHPVKQDRKSFLGKIQNMIKRKQPLDRIAAHLAPILPFTEAESRHFTALVQAHLNLDTLEPLLVASPHDLV